MGNVTEGKVVVLFGITIKKGLSTQTTPLYAIQALSQLSYGPNYLILLAGKLESSVHLAIHCPSFVRMTQTYGFYYQNCGD